MDRNESDLDGSMSNPDEDEDLNDSELDSDDDGGTSALSRMKMEDVGEAELLARLRQQELEEREEIERELKAHKELLQRAEAVHRQRDSMGVFPTGVGVAPSHSGNSSGGGIGDHGNRHVTVDSPPPTMVPLGGGGGGGGLSYASPPTLTASSLSPPSNNLSPLSSQAHSSDNPQTWSFEEQFKQVRQLYELSDDPKRKEFLDELFSYMQKRGTPVNRIPIMAKQVLDLYELYNLVTARGGLVEVINKKIWREITKGLNLPSSITSAAFTLRTQYMKYLYPYECEKKKLSSPAELQAAIDGNRREGRRSSYSTYADMVTSRNSSISSSLNSQMSPLSLVTNRQVNGNGTSHGLSSGEEDSFSSPPTRPSLMMSQREALNLEVPRGMDQSSRPLELSTVRKISAEDEGPPRKRLTTAEEDRLLAHAGLPSAHLKITSRGDGRSQIESSLVVSMEINGIMYQGVLFAQTRAGRLA